MLDTQKAIPIELWNDFSRFTFAWHMPKDKGLHFHQLSCRYYQKGFHRVVQQGEKWLRPRWFSSRLFRGGCFFNQLVSSECNNHRIKVGDFTKPGINIYITGYHKNPLSTDKIS